MSHRYFKIVTPFRILIILFSTFTIVQYLDAIKSVNDGTQEGFSGLGFVITGIAAFVLFILDLLTSYFFKPKKTWSTQIVLLILIIIWFIIFK